ncbi:MAG: conjugal transfer protein TraM [Arcobacteraceae bacterium]|jgi:hypothetical protein|nr:conjugal transfer protein TraM [Arcobacteraceae bacterium]
MTNINKKAIYKAIAEKHHLILDDKDPIFAVVTANEIIFDELLIKADNLFSKQKSELESYKASIINELKEIKKDHQSFIKKELQASNIQPLDNNSTPVKEKEDDKDLLFRIDKTDAKKYWYYHFLPILSSLLIGLSIGLTITYWF